MGFDGQKKSRRGTQDANSQHHGRHALTIRGHGGCWCQERRWHRGAGSDLEGRPSELCLWGWGTEEGHAASERQACGDRHAKSHQSRRASHGCQLQLPSCTQGAMSPLSSSPSFCSYLCHKLSFKSCDVEFRAQAQICRIAGSTVRQIGLIVGLQYVITEELVKQAPGSSF